jgi:hypothetical protein
MWNFANLQNSTFLILFAITIAGSLFWVTYSLQEFLIAFRRNTRSKSIRHQRQMDLFRNRLKKK